MLNNNKSNFNGILVGILHKCRSCSLMIEYSKFNLSNMQLSLDQLIYAINNRDNLNVAFFRELLMSLSFIESDFFLHCLNYSVNVCSLFPNYSDFTQHYNTFYNFVKDFDYIKNSYFSLTIPSSLFESILFIKQVVFMCIIYYSHLLQCGLLYSDIPSVVSLSEASLAKLQFFFIKLSNVIQFILNKDYLSIFDESVLLKNMLLFLLASSDFSSIVGKSSVLEKSINAFLQCDLSFLKYEIVFTDFILKYYSFCIIIQSLYEFLLLCVFYAFVKE